MAPAAIASDGPKDNASTVSLIQAVVRQEIANLGITPVCAVRPNESSASVNQIRVYPSRYPSRYRNPAEWRTSDDRPICFHCSRAGHIARYCRNRWSSNSSWNTGAWRRFEGSSRRFSTPHDPQPAPTNVQGRRFSRSPSPQGRRSLSPMISRSRGSVLEQPCEDFTWRTLSQDHLNAHRSSQEVLVLQTQGLTPQVQALCKSLCQRLERLLEELRPWGSMEEDLQQATVAMLGRWHSFVNSEMAHSTDTDWLALLGQVCQGLAELCPELRLCFPAKKAMSCVISTALQCWGEVQVQEESEGGQQVQSTLRVPLQVTVPLQELLFALCQQVNRLFGHCMPKGIQSEVGQLLMSSLEPAYIRSCQALVTQQLPPALCQTWALQLLMDLHVLNLLFQGGTLSTARAAVEAQVDPFDLDVLMPHLGQQASLAAQQTSLLLGLCLGDVGAGRFLVSGPSGNKAPPASPVVLPVLAAGSQRFPLLPTLSRFLDESPLGTQAPVEEEQQWPRGVTTAGKSDRVEDCCLPKERPLQQRGVTAFFRTSGHSTVTSTPPCAFAMKCCFGEKPKTFHCKVVLLDETELIQEIQNTSRGQDLLDVVYKHLNLLETAYFGLRFVDTLAQTLNAVNSNMGISNTRCGTQTFTFYFGVKFYAADPCKLLEEITRYQYFLQVKQDIYHGRLPINFDLAAELFALAIQSELGDYDPRRHQPGYASELRFLVNQTPELEEKVAELHKGLRGQVPAVAEMNFLDKVKWLDMYGVDLHPVIGEDHTEYFLGLTPSGVIVLRNKTKVSNYYWPRITKVSHKGCYFMLQVHDKTNDDSTYGFELATKQACKHLWKCCVDHHSFFRLTQTTENAIASKCFGWGGKFRVRERPNPGGFKVQPRQQPTFVRVPSRRYQRRLGQPDGADAGTQVKEEEKHVTDHRSGSHWAHTTLLSPSSMSLHHSSPVPATSTPVTTGNQSVPPWEDPKQRHCRSSSTEGDCRRRRHHSRRGSDNESEVSKSSRGSRASKCSRASSGGCRHRHRSRSKSPDVKRSIPEDVKKHIAYHLIDPVTLTEEEKKDIKYTKVETDSRLFKIRYSPTAGRPNYRMAKISSR
ncbi:hypothetical protein HPB51_009813 [Rhipicephalus microplus]|uniref:FERM domain-containing protein n=1 Tax=Rhipicephalus microplus TaxID=6941 RepID=A0A9J6F195_RHIMP|nr:hypothetical protein HPB51_009813 [Rhipicephalus microplus]